MKKRLFLISRHETICNSCILCQAYHLSQMRPVIVSGREPRTRSVITIRSPNDEYLKPFDMEVISRSDFVLREKGEDSQERTPIVPGGF